MCWHRETHARNHQHQHQHHNHDGASIPHSESKCLTFLFVRVWEHAKGMSAESPRVCGSVGHLTALGAPTLAWPQGTRSAKPMFGKLGTSCRGSTSRQTMEACHSCSDTRGTSVFQLAAVDEDKAPIVEHGIKLGPATKRWQCPTPSRTFAVGRWRFSTSSAEPPWSRPSTPPTQTSKKT